MSELKIDYRHIYCPDGLDAFYADNKESDMITVSCDIIIQGGIPDPETLDEYDPRIDVVLREDDERWKRIDDIAQQGQRSH